jgi:hypothetical protein
MYCKAGFEHISLEDCEHIVTQIVPVKRGFQLPDDFYSPEATAVRKAENKARYAAHRSGRTHPIVQAVNEAREVDEKQTF